MAVEKPQEVCCFVALVEVSALPSLLFMRAGKIGGTGLGLLALLGAIVWSLRGGESTGGLIDLTGQTVDPFASGTNGWHLFVFVSNECPISNRYAPEIRRLHALFHPRGVTFWVVHPVPDESVATIQEHTRTYQLPGTVVRDPDRKFTRFVGARVTPEAALCDAGGRLLYRGRIDNRFVALGQARQEATELDLQNALNATMEQRPIPTTRTPAVGCSIPDLP